MRGSTAVLSDTGMRLWELQFPASRVLLARTRVAYLHVDNLIAFSKRDRDGRVDAYLAVYLPDEVVMLFFLDGELVNAGLAASVGRFPMSISDALRHIRSDPDRSEACFHQCSREQLAALWSTFGQRPLDLGLPVDNVVEAFRLLLEQRWSGLLELISNGRVNYLTVRDGRFAGGMFVDQGADELPAAVVSRMITPVPNEPPPRIALKVFVPLEGIPPQAPPAMVAMFRHYLWDVLDLVEVEAPGESIRRAERAHAAVLARHEVIRHFGMVRGAEFADPITEPATLAAAIAEFTKGLLEDLEIAHPLSAERILREAAREHRFALQAVGFFEYLPWRLQW